MKTNKANGLLPCVAQMVAAPPAPAHEVIVAPMVRMGSMCLLGNFGGMEVIEGLGCRMPGRSLRAEGE